MQAIIMAMKAQLVHNILKSDSWVKEVGYDSESNPTQVYFITTDPVSDEELGTGYWSNEGYDWKQRGQLSQRTLDALARVLPDYDQRILENDCEGCENEYAIYLD